MISYDPFLVRTTPMAEIVALMEVAINTPVVLPTSPPPFVEVRQPNRDHRHP